MVVYNYVKQYLMTNIDKAKKWTINLGSEILVTFSVAIDISVVFPLLSIADDISVVCNL